MDLKNITPEKNYGDLLLLSENELRDLVLLTSYRNDLLDQIVKIKCAIKKATKDIKVLKEIIDEALAYERPFSKDPDWGHYDDYLCEMKKSILSLKNHLSSKDLKEVLTYLRDRAEEDEIYSEFEEDGEWTMEIDDINEHLKELD